MCHKKKILKSFGACLKKREREREEKRSPTEKNQKRIMLFKATVEARKPWHTGFKILREPVFLTIIEASQGINQM